MNAKKNKTAAPAARFDFNNAARKVVKDHPQLKGRIIFVDVRHDEFDDLEFALVQKDALEEDIEELRKTFGMAKRQKTSFHEEIELNNKSTSVLVFHPDRYPVFGDKSGAVDDAGTFDHETGHALTTSLKGTLSESTADAYAALRSLQRFGGKTDDIEYAGWKRAAIFMLTGKTSHLTTFALDKIVIDAKTADFLSLSPADTLEVARHAAKQATPDDKRIEKLKRAFRSVAKKKLPQALNQIAITTLKADARSDTFYMGARVMLGALQQGGIELDGRHITLKGDTWDKVKDKITDKIARLPASHPLRQL